MAGQGQAGGPAPSTEQPPGACFGDLPANAVHHIFSFLGPRELCIASTVCAGWRDLNRDGVANRVWHGHFARRWRLPALEGGAAGWQAQYGRKMRGARAFGARGLADLLYGHSGAVRAVALLPSRNLLATGSADCSVRLWDLQAGLPRACSAQLPGAVKCLALDEQLLVGASGQDGALRLWRSRPGAAAGAAFHLTAPTRLQGHTGPIASLALDARSVYSGSWDCSVRVWSRDSLRRVALLAFPDWVSSAIPRGRHLLVTAGQALHVHSLATGQGIAKWRHAPAPGARWEAGLTTAPLQVEGSRDGRLAFVAGADGAISAVDLRTPSPRAAVLWAQHAPIRSLSFEDPWLAAAAGDGGALLLDTDAALRGGRGGASSGGGQQGRRQLPAGGAAGRQRLAAGAGPAFCVDICDGALACGSADPVVRTWSFADRAEQRAATAPPRRRRGAARRRPRSARAAEDSSGGEAGSGDEALHRIPLSQSLPSSLGGAAPAPERRQQQAEASGSDSSGSDRGRQTPGARRSSASSSGDGSCSEARGSDAEGSGSEGGWRGSSHEQQDQEVLHPYLCRFRRGGGAARGRSTACRLPWAGGTGRPQCGSTPEPVRVRS